MKNAPKIEQRAEKVITGGEMQHDVQTRSQGGRKNKVAGDGIFAIFLKTSKATTLEKKQEYEKGRLEVR